MVPVKSIYFFFLISLIVSCKNYEPQASGGEDVINEEPLTVVKNDSSEEQSKVLIITNEYQEKSHTGKCEKCDIQIVVETDLNMTNLDDSNISEFLCTMDKACCNNIEFSEYSNEVLFKLIKSYPEKFVGVMSSSNNLQKDYIYKELSSPLLDYDIKQIMEAMRRVNHDQEVKTLILKALENAS